METKRVFVAGSNGDAEKKNMKLEVSGEDEMGFVDWERADCERVRSVLTR